MFVSINLNNYFEHILSHSFDLFKHTKQLKVLNHKSANIFLSLRYISYIRIYAKLIIGVLSCTLQIIQEGIYTNIYICTSFCSICYSPGSFSSAYNLFFSQNNIVIKCILYYYLLRLTIKQKLYNSETQNHSCFNKFLLSLIFFLSFVWEVNILKGIKIS